MKNNSDIKALSKQATMDNEWTEIFLGRITQESLGNIARELRVIWARYGDIRPNGDRKKRANLKASIDKYGCYHLYLNKQAIEFVMLSIRHVADLSLDKQLTVPPCPPEVPECLRWG